MKFFKTFFIFLVLFLLPLANAGQIEKIFGGGIFGLKWGSTIEEVQNVFPEGKSSKSSGYLKYTIKDDRTIFGVERKKTIRLFFILTQIGG